MKILKYEWLNILRNKWLIVYTVLIAALTFTLIIIGGSFSKALLSIANVIVILVPLVSLLFTVVYWYYNEKYTEMLLTQPLSRKSIFFARFLALAGSQSLSVSIGLLLPFLFYNGLSKGVFLNVLIADLLTVTFVAIGLWIAMNLNDRMKGVGIALGIWFFFSVVYDGLILLLLISFKEYPLDYVSGVLGVLNPIGLSRVILLMFHNGSLLLGYAGSLAYKLLTESSGYFIVALVAMIWLIVPLSLAKTKMMKKDF
jgi:Cu-processing system permease protein